MAFNNPDEILQSLTSSGLYRLFARPTPSALRRRFATGEVSEDVTPGFMPGGADFDPTRGGFPGIPQVSGIGQEDIAQYLGRPGEGARYGFFRGGSENLAQDIRGLKSEFSMQQAGLIKSIAGKQAVGGLTGSQAAQAAGGLGLESFQQQASAALAPLLAAQRRMVSRDQMLAGMVDDRNRRAAQLAASKTQPILRSPRRGSLFFATPGSQFGAERRR